MRRICSYLVALVLTGGLIFTGATPANAASCSSGRVCFWQYSNYAGFSGWDYYPNPCLNVSYPMNNEITSLIIGARPGGGSDFFRFYNAQDCQGSPVWWGYSGDAFTTVSVAANNVITSFSRSATP